MPGCGSSIVITCYRVSERSLPYWQLQTRTRSKTMSICMLQIPSHCHCHNPIHRGTIRDSSACLVCACCRAQPVGTSCSAFAHPLLQAFAIGPIRNGGKSGHTWVVQYVQLN